MRQKKIYIEEDNKGNNPLGDLTRLSSLFFPKYSFFKVLLVSLSRWRAKNYRVQNESYVTRGTR